MRDLKRALTALATLVYVIARPSGGAKWREREGCWNSLDYIAAPAQGQTPYSEMWSFGVDLLLFFVKCDR
jgi:hypothetical protein